MRKLVGVLWLGLGCAGEPPFVDDDNDGFAAADDCDDNNAAIHPDAVDLLRDGIDADCSGADGPGELPLNSLHAGVNGVGTNGERGAFNSSVCELNGDDVSEALISIQRSDPATLRILSSPMEPGLLSLATASTVFSLDNARIFGTHCGDWNGDGRDDIISFVSAAIGFRLAVWQQPEGGFAARLTDADALTYTILEAQSITVSFGEYDDTIGVDATVQMEFEDGSTSYDLLSGGSPAGAMDTLTVPFGLESEPSTTSIVRIQLDDDADLEAVACGPEQGCRLLDGYAFDGSDAGDTLLGTFESSSVAGNVSVVVGDFDGGGEQNDLIGYTYGREFDVYLNIAEQLAAAGVVSPNHHIGVTTGYMSNVGDLDGDGVDDVAVPPVGEENQSITVYSMAALMEGFPVDALLLDVDVSPRIFASARAGDLDGDGHSDVLFSAFDYDSSGQLGVYLSSQTP